MIGTAAYRLVYDRMHKLAFVVVQVNPSKKRLTNALSYSVGVLYPAVCNAYSEQTSKEREGT